MNKVLVKICVPAAGDSFDMFVPVDIPIKDVGRVMADGVVEITNGKYITSGLEQMCMKDPTGLLDPTRSLQDYGVRGGAEIYLI